MRLPHVPAVKVPVALVSLALLSGCVVSKKKYDALEAELARTQAQMEATVAERDQTISTLEASVAAEQKVVAQLGGEIAALEADLEARRAELEALQGEKAALLKDRSRLKASVEEMEQALVELAARKAAADKRLAEYQGLLERFKGLIDAGKLSVRIVDGQMVLELATDILFESGSAELSADGQAALTEVAGLLSGIPERRFQVAGHTDDVPIKTAKYPSNWELASARATVVVKTMVDGGLSPERLSAASFSEFQPRVPNDTKESRAMNRRIEIIVVPDLSQLPGFDELQALEKDGG